MRLEILVGLLTVGVTSFAPAQDSEPMAKAVAALEKIGARINAADVSNAAGRPVRGVLFPRKSCEITDADLEHLKALPDLQYVFIIGQKKVTGEGLKHLAGLKKLDTIDLRDTPIQSKYLVHLGDLKQLHKLGLWHTAVDDEGMFHLKGLVNLEHLYLDRTGVGDKGIEALGPNPSLCDVSWDGSRITDKGVALMKKNLPRFGKPPLRGD